MQWNRRDFLKHTAAFSLAGVPSPASRIDVPLIRQSRDGITVNAPSYTFTWSRSSDEFCFIDALGRLISSAPLQPIVVERPVGQDAESSSLKGRPASLKVNGSRAEISYVDVNGAGQVTVPLRFDAHGFWIEPILYENAVPADIVSVHYFSSLNGTPRPALRATYFTMPGIGENAAISPIQRSNLRLDQTISLGHSGAPSIEQQWGLPVHYFCASSAQPANSEDRENFATGRSATMVCGLADLPNADAFFTLHEGKASLWMDYRSDLWHHVRTPGAPRLGATLSFVAGTGLYEGISTYYRQLLGAGVIEQKVNSPKKNAVLFSPQFCTWGEQIERKQDKANLTEKFLEDLYQSMKSQGMKAGMFSIDDKWEGRYGNLEHASDRLPNFPEFLDRVRAEGHHVGLWSAFMRCEDPADLGLTVEHMLQRPDGTPYKAVDSGYFLLDFTHPEVEKVLTERATVFMRRYKPALVKFDFGYELPAVRLAAPFDKRFAGELVLKKGLEIIVGALRRENPDVVVMYYQLSPLFVEYFDLHSIDDLYLAEGDYDWEANRRIYFSSPLTQLGVPIYGSSGYDWSSSPAIWFDSVVAGTIGSLNTFVDDEFGESATPEFIAIYNGLIKTLRTGNLFEVIPFPSVRSEAATRGAHSPSWARLENGKITLIAKRPTSFNDGDMFDHRPPDVRVHNLINTSAPIVVASKTDDAISTSGHLAIVACADGKASIRRDNGQVATVVTHSFGGGSASSLISITAGMLNLDLFRKDPSGTPIEWLEVLIS